MRIPFSPSSGLDPDQVNLRLLDQIRNPVQLLFALKDLTQVLLFQRPSGHGPAGRSFSMWAAQSIRQPAALPKLTKICVIYSEFMVDVDCGIVRKAS